MVMYSKMDVVRTLQELVLRKDDSDRLLPGHCISIFSIM